MRIADNIHRTADWKLIKLEILCTSVYSAKLSAVVRKLFAQQLEQQTLRCVRTNAKTNNVDVNYVIVNVCTRDTVPY